MQAKRKHFLIDSKTMTLSVYSSYFPLRALLTLHRVGLTVTPNQSFASGQPIFGPIGSDCRSLAHAPFSVITVRFTNHSSSSINRIRNWIL